MGRIFRLRYHTEQLLLYVLTIRSSAIGYNTSLRPISKLYMCAYQKQICLAVDLHSPPRQRLLCCNATIPRPVPLTMRILPSWLTPSALDSNTHVESVIVLWGISKRYIGIVFGLMSENLLRYIVINLQTCSTRPNSTESRLYSTFAVVKYLLHRFK